LTADNRMDPATTNLGARILAAIKEWPLWTLVAVALSLSVMLAVPDFRGLLFPSVTILIFVVVVAWIFVVARAAQPIYDAVSAHRRHREEKRHFFVSPVEAQSHWGFSKQPDGSYITQLSLHCLVTNRSARPLYPTTARLIRPKIKGEALPNPIFIASPEGGTFGTAAISRNYIQPGGTLPISVLIMVRGRPKQKDGPMHATIDIDDADGHRERIRVRFVYFGPPAT
jgi:hypothetical protein